MLLLMAQDCPGRTSLMPVLSVHKQTDGTIYAAGFLIPILIRLVACSPKDRI